MAALTIHAPIYICGDADFAAQALAGGWPGDGSHSAPYIIENFNISAASANGIEIDSTTVHFIIRGCYVHDGVQTNEGIWLYDCTNGVVTSNVCYNNYDDIRLDYSTGNVISENNCSNNYKVWQWGIYLVDSNSNSVCNNTFWRNEVGIGLTDSNGIVVSNNSFSGDYVGMEFYDSIGTLKNNTFVNEGILIDGSSASNATGSSIDASNTINGKPVTFCKNQIGGTVPAGGGQIILVNCTDMTVENQVLNHTTYAIQLVYCSNMMVSGNNCSNNGDGIYLTSSCNNTIRNNSCFLNRYAGIVLRTSSDNNVVESNNCSGNSVGIDIGESSNDTIIGNTFSSNKDIGAVISGNDDMFANNTCNGNNDGIFISCSNWCTIRDCTVSYNKNKGISIEWSDNNVFSNNSCTHSTWGIDLYIANYSIFTNNDFSSNTFGIDLSFGHDNTFTNNRISSNSLWAVYSGGADNLFLNNSFISNNHGEPQANDYGTDNQWSTSGLSFNYGNYWSDWTTPNNLLPWEIVDLPYNLSGTASSKDYYPLTVMPGSTGDVTAPACTIMQPTSGSSYTTKWGQIKLAGIASDNIAVISVNWTNSLGGSGSAYMSPQYGGASISWQSRGNVMLYTGTNIITVTAKDWAGNTRTDTLVVNYDNIYPTVAITSPTNNSSYYTSGYKINLAGSASDNSGSFSVTWKNMATGASGIASGTTSWSISNIALNHGANSIYVNATDAAGNKVSDLIVVTRSTNTLMVTITAPTSNPSMATGWYMIGLRGTASDDIMVTRVAWTNSLGGSGDAYMNPQYGGTSVDWQSRGNVFLSEGDNLITVTAYDNEGNSATDILVVSYSANLTVSITVPTALPAMTTSWHMVNLMGTAMDDYKVVSVTWTNSLGGSGVAYLTPQYGGASITWQCRGNVLLYHGDNVITVTATDNLGNIATDVLTVTYTGY